MRKRRGRTGESKLHKHNCESVVKKIIVMVRRHTVPTAHTNIMAKEIKDIKQFVELARRSDVKSGVIKTNKKVNASGKVFKQTKFKVRGARYNYTLVVNDAAKAKKLQQSLPPTLEIKNL